MRIDSIWKLVKPNDSTKTIIKNLCGEKIGVGLYRDVYVCKHNQNYVVKVERDMTTGTFANVTEWRNYINNAEWIFLRDWLAPCSAINFTGNILIQKRVTHGKRKDFPKYIPIMFTDLKLKNFGWIGDKFVCCDYSYMVFSFTKNKMKYAKWWN